MAEGLKGILEEFYTDAYNDGSRLGSENKRGLDQAIKDIQAWARSCLPEEKESIDYSKPENKYSEFPKQWVGHNACRTTTLNNISKGE